MPMLAPRLLWSCWWLPGAVVAPGSRRTGRPPRARLRSAGLGYEYRVPRPTVLLLSTSDTDLMTGRATGVPFRLANPSRLVDGELPDLLGDADLVVVRVLGGYRAWPDGIDACAASGLPVVVVSGEQAPDADLMERSTVPAGIAVQAHTYLAEGGVENLRQLHAFLCDTVLMTGFGFARRPHPGVGRAVAGDIADRRADDRGALLPRSAVGRETPPTSRRCAGRSRTPRPAAAGVLHIAAQPGGRPAGIIGHRRCHGGHRAGRRRATPATAGAGGADDGWDVQHLAALDVPILQGLCLTSSRPGGPTTTTG